MNEADLTISDSTILISTDKEVYGTREKIQLIISTQDKNNRPIGANLSISITDENQVNSIINSKNILQNYFLPEIPDPAKIFFPADQGIVVSGVVKNKKQNPENANVTAILGKFDDILMFETDDSGKFDLNGLQFYDSIDLAFQAKDKKNKPIGGISLTARDAHPVSSFETYNFQKIETSSVQRLFSELEIPKETIVLDDIVVTGSRIEEPSDEIQHKIYGKPDHVVTSEELARSSTSNLVVALQGKIPGVSFVQVADNTGIHYKIRIRGLSTFWLNTEPLVVIDGIPVGGQDGITTLMGGGQATMGNTAGDRLAMLDPNLVDRVEVTLRTNGLYGDLGRNGVIAVFTKAGSSIDNYQDLKTMEVFKIRGYNLPRSFKSPDYSDSTLSYDKPDFRSTVYWNPTIRTNSDTGEIAISFYASDVAGRYKIIVEGVTEFGEPVQCVDFIRIERK
ncbi:MAG: TonB-dependent receptor plug domain-containing protein [Flammeovirgaceae bacterium]|nr:TonB-dependent receptor plug domain-containing protein [Flammeovirgaceae bacterium]